MTRVSSSLYPKPEACLDGPCLDTEAEQSVFESQPKQSSAEVLLLDSQWENF